MGLYQEIVSRLKSKKDVYVGKKQVISFQREYSQKIENRSLGVVAGLRGSLNWTINNRPTPAEYDFLILEYDSNHDTDNKSDTSFQFAQDTVRKKWL